MRKFLEVAGTGLTAILLHRQRSMATVGCLVAVLLPYTTGLGISQGIQRQAEDAIRFGADFYVTGVQMGRNVPIPISAVDQIRRIEGVTRATPRIVGGVTLGLDHVQAVVVGIDSSDLDSRISCVEGRPFARDAENELVVGSELARRLRLQVGSLIPPFYRNRKGERVSKVVGIFRSDIAIWQSHLILTSFETASRFFNQEHLASDVLVYCRAGSQTGVRSAILRAGLFDKVGSAPVGTRLVDRADLTELIPRSLLHREGIFNLHFVLVFAMAIPVMLLTSGLGLSERRREIGILKAIGWHTDEVLVRSLAESLVLSVAGTSASIALAFVWLNWFNGIGLVSIFFAGTEGLPGFRVPFHLAPVPALLCCLVSFSIVMTGSIYSTWRAAIGSPGEMMR
jgi:ABC-type lipoprotein release transport system permease subunit